MFGTSLLRPGELFLRASPFAFAPRPNCIVRDPVGPLTSNLTYIMMLEPVK